MDKHEPVAWMHNFIEGNVITHKPADIGRHPDRWTPLYTAPPKRDSSSWVGLTDAQVEEIAEYHGIDGLYETSRIDFYRAIEITLKEKNT